MSGRFFAQTTGFNKSYIGALWTTRHQLSLSEKRGFAQFFYLTISGHVEKLLSLIISARLDSILRLPLGSLPPQKGSVDGMHISCSVEPICDSLVNIISVYRLQLENAPLQKLISCYQDTFRRSLADVIGRDLSSDIDALSALRNIFAHGRDLYLEFDFDDDNSEIREIVTLNKNPLQKPVERLRAAGIMTMSPADIDGMNWGDFLAVIYCDEALSYFFRAVKEAEDKLMQTADYPFEAHSLFIVPLPDLDHSEGLPPE